METVPEKKTNGKTHWWIIGFVVLVLVAIMTQAMWYSEEVARSAQRVQMRGDSLYWSLRTYELVEELFSFGRSVCHFIIWLVFIGVGIWFWKKNAKSRRR